MLPVSTLHTWPCTIHSCTTYINYIHVHVLLVVHIHNTFLFLFFWGALESDMRGYCEKCWALVLLPRTNIYMSCSTAVLVLLGSMVELMIECTRAGSKTSVTTRDTA